MKITEDGYTLKMSRDEIECLAAALKELALLQLKYPDERNGFGMRAQNVATNILCDLNRILEPNA